MSLIQQQIICPWILHNLSKLYINIVPLLHCSLCSILYTVYIEYFTQFLHIKCFSIFSEIKSSQCSNSIDFLDLNNQAKAQDALFMLHFQMLNGSTILHKDCTYACPLNLHSSPDCERQPQCSMLCTVAAVARRIIIALNVPNVAIIFDTFVKFPVHINNPATAYCQD